MMLKVKYMSIEVKIKNLTLRSFLDDVFARHIVNEYVDAKFKICLGSREIILRFPELSIKVMILYGGAEYIGRDSNDNYVFVL